MWKLVLLAAFVGNGGTSGAQNPSAGTPVVIGEYWTEQACERAAASGVKIRAQTRGTEPAIALICISARPND